MTHRNNELNCSSQDSLMDNIEYSFRYSALLHAYTIVLSSGLLNLTSYQNIVYRLVSVISLVFSGLSDDSSGSKKKAASHATSHGSTGTKVAIICIALVAVGLFSFFLFKLYQKKKREEQYARLLKLFEEDDELELELGLRD